MKNTIKLLSALILFLILNACNKKTDPDEENPTSGECMDFVEIDDGVDSSSKIIHLEFIDDNNGWAIMERSGNLYKLLNTTDAGVTWQIINDNFQMDFDNGFVSGEALKFVTATNGFKIYRTSSSKLAVQYTTDKGATWADYDNPFIDANGNYESYGIGETFASNGTQTLLISGGTTSGAGWTYKTIIIIDNATMNIIFSENEKYDPSVIPLYYPVNIEDSSAGSYHYAANGTITAVVTETSNNTGDLKMAQSTDNGATWTITSNVLDGDYLKSSSWVNDNVGYVAVGYYSGTKNLYKTTDGGATWVKLNAPPDFQMIRFADENNGIGVTDFDFYYTINGGTSWTEIEVCKNSEGQYIMGYDEVIAYPSVNNGWVAGSKYHADFSGSDEGIFHFQGE